MEYLTSLTGLPPAHSLVAVGATLAVLVLTLRLLFRRNRVVPKAADLMQSAFGKEQVGDKVNDYMEHWQKTDMSKDDGTPQMIGDFYALVTDFYEYGWGQSFHFACWRKNESFKDAMLRQEHRIAKKLGLKPGMRALDVGCGVGGPLRNIARFSGANVTGVTICEYQVKRAQEHIVREGLQNQCKVEHGNFLELKQFEDNTFDGVYGIEATCHAPDLADCYRQVYRVLKPGARFAVYEWVTTDKYDHNNPVHRKIIDDINLGNGVPNMRNQADVVPIAEKLGFKTISACDYALKSEHKWYRRLDRGRLTHFLTHAMCWFLETIRWAPKGTLAVSSLLVKTGKDLCESGKLGIFTPMYLYVFEKPAN